MMQKGFLWGGAVTAHQSEGAYTACGKSPAVCDLFPKPEHSDFKDGIDEFHRYDEDFSLFEEMGFTSYRFSIDWSRVCPDGVNFSEEGMQFYDDFIDSMIAHGMEPMCSLYHFEMPQSLMNEYNGFYSRKVVDMFVTYANKMIDRYGDRVKKWISFNEQNAIGIPGSKKVAYGAVCPKDVPENKFIAQLVHNTFIAHAKVVEKVHTIKDAIILGMNIYIPTYGATCNPLDIEEAMNQMAINDMYFEMFTYGKYSSYMWSKYKKENCVPEMEEGDLKLLENNKCDWLSLSYYFSTVASAGKQSVSMDGNAKATINPYLKSSEWGWQIDPISLRLGLRDIYAKYRLPVMVVENGFGMRDKLVNNTVEDNERINYMRDHIDQISQAIDEGVDCRGYLMWGPIDILSSQGEMGKRYGTIYVNRDDKDLKDMKRYKKKSFNWYKKVISTNGKDTKNED
ncbi:MAG: glycoside hydrolase family 1 protein [Thomasclavelia sp.]|nr:glycoside hydrolase family 1 protein [Thomasclavelia sp.]